VTRQASRFELELAYCAWSILAPHSLSRYDVPQLTPWSQLFVDVVKSAPSVERGDSPGQHFRRAIIRGATQEQPFPGEVRGKAILVEGMVRMLSVQRLASIGGTPVDICKALGCKPLTVRPSAWRRDLELATS
jgi:hypothetical protein